MAPGSPLLIPPGDGQEGKIIISAVERRDEGKFYLGGPAAGMGSGNLITEYIAVGPHVLLCFKIPYFF